MGGKGRVGKQVGKDGCRGKVEVGGKVAGGWGRGWWNRGNQDESCRLLHQASLSQYVLRSHAWECGCHSRSLSQVLEPCIERLQTLSIPNSCRLCEPSCPVSACILIHGVYICVMYLHAY